MTTLTYLKGDVTQPQRDNDEHIVICHIVNDIGAWGAGVSGAIGKAFPEAETNYRDRYFYRLGEVDFIKTDQGITIANMVAQHSTGMGSVTIANEVHAPRGKEFSEEKFFSAVVTARPPIRYFALAECMEEVRAFCYADGKPWCSIHAPRFGSALAGGNWGTIEALILEVWVDAGIEVTIYDFA